jgi:hypothetical protein
VIFLFHAKIDVEKSIFQQQLYRFITLTFQIYICHRVMQMTQVTIEMRIQPGHSRGRSGGGGRGRARGRMFQEQFDESATEIAQSYKERQTKAVTKKTYDSKINMFLSWLHMNNLYDESVHENDKIIISIAQSTTTDFCTFLYAT